MGSKCTTIRSGDTASSKGGALFFGHPLLDMMAPVDEAFMNAYGVAAGSVNLAEPQQMPIFNYITSELGDVVEFVPGGSAMNAARTLAWLRPELPVSYVGALGKDQFADILKVSLSTAGVRPLFEEHTAKPTGTCACLVVDKERALLANLGAAVELSKEFMESEAVHQCIEDATLYYAEGFFLNTASSPDGLLSVAKHAHQAQKVFCFNLNAPYISAVFKDSVDALMPYVDILFGNAEDIMSYATSLWPKEFGETTSPVTVATVDDHISSSGSDCVEAFVEAPSANNAEDTQGASSFASPDPTEPPKGQNIGSEDNNRLHHAVRKVAELPCHGRRRMVVVTCGADNTLIGSSDGEVREFVVPPINPDEMIDSNGAGDAFVGGFLAQYTLVKDEVACINVAHEAAQNCIRHNGAVVSGPVPPLVHGHTAKRQSPTGTPDV